MDLRVIKNGPADAGTNMARDREILKAIDNDPMYAVLRWYTWSLPAFSLGYGQKPENALDLRKLESSRIKWVKRPTGGAMVFHGADLSYSFTFPARRFSLSSYDLYSFLSAALIRGLKRLGVPASRPEKIAPERGAPTAKRQVCLAFNSPGDILLNGKKLAGAAQRRLRNAWQQQGFLLHRPIDFPDCFADPEVVATMKSTSIDLHTFGCNISMDRLREVLAAAVVEKWNELLSMYQEPVK
jgi:lipoate-protein ligase A